MLETMKPDEFDAVYAVMEASFPADERRTYVEQKKLFDDKKYTLYVQHSTENNDIAAFVAVFRFDTFAFIEHLAVNPAYRNNGLGSAILYQLKSTLNCRICLEVEPPETPIAERRINFYERNGFYLNNYHYVQPAFSEDKNPVPLLVMTTHGAVNNDEFLQIKHTLYKEVYHINE